MMLYPNCSEIVFRLDSEEYEVQTDTYPNDAINIFLDYIDTNNDLPEPEFIDNIGGGGHWSVIEDAYMIGQAYLEDRIDRETAYLLDKLMWEGKIGEDDLPSLLNDKRISLITKILNGEMV